MINWIKKLFASDKVETDQWGLPKFDCNIPMPEVKPCKQEKNISEPVHVIVKNMLEHPQRWKVKTEVEDHTHSSVTFYTVKDTKTGEEFKARKTRYWGGDSEKVSLVSWVTVDEIELLEETLYQVYEVKKLRRKRLADYKKSQERKRLLEIYK